MRTGNSQTSPDDLRRKFLAFFEGKGHLVYPSASLKSDDPALLFNVAGMQQFKPYFQGATPKFPGIEGVWRRVATAQKCMRAGGKDSDIENVGRTRRHHTFFEMLGNFSFGDYFKREAIHWAWEFLTSREWVGLDPDRLYVTVFLDDDEAYDIWTGEVGVPPERLSRWDEAENFWPANALKNEREGPCGPCSEIFYDRGPLFGTADETGPNTGSGDRFLEVWNLVFTQFDLKEGELKPLPQKNIDTGMGFERLVAVVSDSRDAYDSVLFAPVMNRLTDLSGQPYQDLESVEQRIIADHVRTVTFAIGDGILPANDGAGYVIKMLIRRASRQAYLLGLRKPILHELAAGVIEAYQGGYPELREAEARVKLMLKSEEEQFLRTLESGMARVAHLLDELTTEVLPGKVAFELWDTYGFPLDLTREIAAERGIKVDVQGYEAQRERARQVSRAAAVKGDMFGASDELLADLADSYGETPFVGYDRSDAEATVTALINNGEPADQVAEGDSALIVLSRTPFYAEGGGQVGDAGALEWPGGKALITGTSGSGQGLHLHHARILRGRLNVGDAVHAKVDPSRAETQKHHTATHLLHAALRSVLGAHVAQAGSLVAPDRLRFDFSHPKALESAQLERLETLVNRWIQADFPVSWRVLPLAEAKSAGATMLFGEKYGEQVRMVTVGDEHAGEVSGPGPVSVELCGGTHVNRTGEIGALVLTAETAVSAGVRRIEAAGGMAALDYTRQLRATIDSAAKQLGARSGDLPARIERLQGELRAAQKEVESLRDRLAAAQTAGGSEQRLAEAGGFRYVVGRLDGLDAAALRNAADTLLARSQADLAVVASGRLLAVKVSKPAIERGAHAGNLIRELAARAGGRGGGKADLAQAGVPDAGKLDSALDAMPDILAAVRA